MNSPALCDDCSNYNSVTAFSLLIEYFVDSKITEQRKLFFYYFIFLLEGRISSFTAIAVISTQLFNFGCGQKASYDEIWGGLERKKNVKKVPKERKKKSQGPPFLPPARPVPQQKRYSHFSVCLCVV